MSPRLRVSRPAIDLLKRFEGFQPRAAALPDGRWIIGHGHTFSAREGAVVSPEDAEALLIFDLMAVGRALEDLIFAPLNQNQFDALCAFVFNIGVDAFRRSQVLRRVNESSPLQAACAMELWRQAEVSGERMVIDALVRRRAAEKVLFLTPPDGAWPQAPSQILRPLLDTESPVREPREPPTPVTAVFEDGRLLLVRADAAPAARPDPIRTAAEATEARLATLFPDEAPAGSPEDPGEALGLAPVAPGTADDQLELELQSPPDAAEDSAASPAEPEPADTLADVVFEEPPPPEPLPEAAPDHADPLLKATEDAPTYPFRQPLVLRQTRKPRHTGLAALALLALIGIAFFAGGVFWGFNAAPSSLDSYVTPQAVGWLAGVAGILMFALAVFLLLQRLGRAAEAAVESEDGDQEL